MKHQAWMVETKAEYYVAKPLRAAQSGSEPEQSGLAPEPEPLDQLRRWSQAMSGPSQAVTTLAEVALSDMFGYFNYLILYICSKENSS